MTEKSTERGFTCSGCDNTWRGFSRCHCRACHRLFGGIALFDRHRRDVKGVGTCLDPETLIVTDKDTGETRRAMFLTGDTWQGVEEPADRGAALRLWRDRHRDNERKQR